MEDEALLDPNDAVDIDVTFVLLDREDSIHESCSDIRLPETTNNQNEPDPRRWYILTVFSLVSCVQGK